MPSNTTLPAFARPSDMDARFGWQVNIQLIAHLEKHVTYPAHPHAMEQIILEYERIRSGDVVLAPPAVHPDQQPLNLPNPNTGD